VQGSIKLQSNTRISNTSYLQNEHIHTLEALTNTHKRRFLERNN